MSTRFENQIAVVTGAASGIGAAIARELAAGGAHVVLADRDGKHLENVADGIKASGGQASAFEVDVSSPDQVRAMFIDYPTGAGFTALFATHPSIEDRVDALVRYAGGLDLPVHPELPPAPPAPPSLPADDAGGTRGPWG